MTQRLNSENRVVTGVGFDAGKNLYELYRKTPPARRGALHVVAYWHGYDGLRNTHSRGSYAHWAWKAGRDNKRAEAQSAGGAGER